MELRKPDEELCPNLPRVKTKCPRPSSVLFGGEVGVSCCWKRAGSAEGLNNTQTSLPGSSVLTLDGEGRLQPGETGKSIRQLLRTLPFILERLTRVGNDTWKQQTPSLDVDKHN